MMMRLDKYLADMEIGTRSQVKQYLKKGLVQVNGEVERRPERKIEEAADTVVFQGRPVVYRKFVYYMFHKPAGCVSATRDNQHKTVLEFFKDAPGKDLFPVGRLDIDTEGLLIVTNDGPLCHALLAPARHVQKTYYAKVRGQIKQEAVQLFQQGIDIGDDTPTAPADLELLTEGEQSEIRLTITEGRFHQVKRMIAAVGGEVVYLKRLSMGSVTLDAALKPGEFRPLTEEELIGLRKNL